MNNLQFLRSKLSKKNKPKKKEITMAIIPQLNLFSWDKIEVSSELNRLKLVLVSIPDEIFVCTLEVKRQKGRDDYPVRPMWNTLLAGIVFQHKTVAKLLRELKRNAELRQILGFNPLLGDSAVPTEAAFSRFVKSVIENQNLLTQMFHNLVAELKTELPDLGKDIAIDSKAIPSFGKPVNDEKKKESHDGRRDVDANWGVKSYKGIHKDGTSWEKVTKWFGYKLHLMVDSNYELPLAFSVDVASSSDMTNLLPLVENLSENHTEIYENVEKASADRGYDSAKNKSELFDLHNIKPIIDTRILKKEDKDKPQKLFGDRYDVFTFNEQGQVFCHCPKTEERRELVSYGFEKKRGTLKFRCPAAHYGFECKGREDCEKCSPLGTGEYGRVVRIPIGMDRRIFTPVNKSTNQWQKDYNKRTSVERVNGRIDQVLGFEYHTIRGKDKMKMRLSLALVIMLSMALGRIRNGQKDKMRSLIAPVAKVA